MVDPFIGSYDLICPQCEKIGNVFVSKLIAGKGLFAGFHIEEMAGLGCVPICDEIALPRLK